VDSDAGLIDTLIEDFSFPDLYERSWHGVSEHFFYDSMMRSPITLNVVGMNKLRNKLPETAERFEKCLEVYAESEPDRVLKFI